MFADIVVIAGWIHVSMDWRGRTSSTVGDRVWDMGRLLYLQHDHKGAVTIFGTQPNS